MVSAGDFKNGLTLEIEEGQVFQILEFLIAQLLFNKELHKQL